MDELQSLIQLRDLIQGKTRGQGRYKDKDDFHNKDFHPKGKGKGSSRGGGQRRGGADRDASKDWACDVSACEWAQKGWLNHSYRKSCGWCGTSKGAAMSPPLAESISGQAKLKQRRRQPQ